MAFANLFSSPPGEVDFNYKTSACHNSDQPYQKPKRPYQNPRNGNPEKRKKKNDGSSGDARKGYDSQTDGPFHTDPFRYEEDQADAHQKLSRPLTWQSRLGPSSDGHLRSGQMRECERVNKREHFAKNNTHRANIKYVHKRQGQDTNRGKGCVLEDKRRTNSRRGAFNQRHEAGSKRGRDKWQMQRHMPKQEERKPFMTEEFKEQNSIAVNGRLICKHFLWERCLKGDECQFEHSRDLGSFKLNEVCKFYVQGFCLKGDHCLYMHKTFPCKFFHTGNTCYHDNNCKFSHDPLTDLTKRLLDKYLEEQKVDTGTLESETQELEPEPAVDFLTNPVKLSFYSTAPVPEPHPPRPFGFGANDAEFSSERHSSAHQPPVHTDTAASTGADPAPDTHTPHTATPSTTLPSQTDPVKLGFFSSAPRPVSNAVSRFGFGANDAEFSSERPSSAHQPAPSPAHTDRAASTGADPTPDAHTPHTATPPTTLPSQADRPTISISSAPSACEDPPRIKTEGSSSPTPPGPTPSVLSTLFTHLSPCRPDEDYDDGHADLEMDAADSCTDTAPLMDGTRLCFKVSKEETGGHTKASSVVSERVLALKSEPAFVKVMKKEEDVKEEPVAIRRKPVSCSTPITNPHRSYKPLAVDLSPLPPLPFNAYQPQPPTHVPWDFSPKAPTPSAHSNSQEAVRQRAPLHTEVGIPMAQADSQGRHSLPVQTVTWSVPSKRSVRQPMLRDRSLSAELEPR